MSERKKSPAENTHRSRRRNKKNTFSICLSTLACRGTWYILSIDEDSRRLLLRDILYQRQRKNTTSESSTSDNQTHTRCKKKIIIIAPSNEKTVEKY